MSFLYGNNGMILENDAQRTIDDNRFLDFIEMVRNPTISVNSYINGRRPIHEVCMHGHKVLLEYLIDQGVDLNNTDWKKMTPIMICIKYRNWECLKILLSAGALYSMDIKKWVGAKRRCGEIREQVSRIMSEILWERRKGIIYYYYLQDKAMLPLAIFRELVSFI